jgi:hypothetical protein
MINAVQMNDLYSEEILREQKSARENQINRLKTLGIEPTEENIQELARQDRIMTEKLLAETHKKRAEDRIRRRELEKRTFHGKIFDTIEEADEERKKWKQAGAMVDLLEKIYSNCYPHELPLLVMKRIDDSVRLKNDPLSADFELTLKYYLLGKLDGIRSERAKRRSKVR